MKRSHLRRHGRAYLVGGGILGFIVLAVGSTMAVPYTTKVILGLCAAANLALLIIAAYRYAMRGHEQTPPLPPRDSLPATAQLPILPPKPVRPPQLPAQTQQPAPPQPITTPALYDHHPRPIPAICYSLLGAITLLLLCLLGVGAQTTATWILIAVCGIIIVGFCYWQWITWRGTYLIITKDTKELQRAKPWPFGVSTPAMPNKIGTVQNVQQTFLDRLFGTCTLFSDIKAEGDEAFHGIKWLPYPEELREAVGHTQLRKNSWLPFSRKKF